MVRLGREGMIWGRNRMGKVRLRKDGGGRHGRSIGGATRRKEGTTKEKVVDGKAQVRKEDSDGEGAT